MCNSITKTIHFAHLGILFVYGDIFAENRGGSVCGSCSDLISALTLTTVFSAPSPPPPLPPPPRYCFFQKLKQIAGCSLSYTAGGFYCTGPAARKIDKLKQYPQYFDQTGNIHIHLRRRVNTGSAANSNGWDHRRRITTEEKTKGHPFCLGEEFIQFLASLAFLPRTISKNRLNASFSFKSPWCNSSYYSKSPSTRQLARQRIE